MPYPTREEILRGNVKHKPEVIRCVKEWKRTAWKEARNANDETMKRIVLTTLITRIACLYENPVSFVFLSQPPRYERHSHTIIMDKVSIITALHELSHHLFGDSERKACRWSVWLFMKTFPRAYATLSWDRHMLIRVNTGNTPTGNAQPQV